MIRHLPFTLLFCLALALPAHSGQAPASVPAAGQTGTSAPPKAKERVIVIKTAPDPKETKVKIGGQGEILIPQSTAAIATAAMAGAAGGGALAAPGVTPADPGLLKEAGLDEDAKGSPDSDKASDAGGSASPATPTAGDIKSPAASASAAAGAGLLGGAAAGLASAPSSAEPVIVLSNTITATAGDHGSISPSGTVTVLQGSNQTFVITPDADYRVADVQVDGASAGAVTSYTFSNVGSDHTIAASFTSSLPTAGLQALLDQTVSASGIPGALMAVQTTSGTWIGASGLADLGDESEGRSPQAMTADTQVRLAGVTKLFTAALILKLVEENRLTLDDTVEQWLPDWSYLIPGSDQITVRMLLNHTSGLHDHETTPEFLYFLYYFDPTYFWTPEDVLAITDYYPLDFDPGTDFNYCNTGYYILGMIAEAATGEPVETMIQTRFFDPLGLSRTALTRSGLLTPPCSHYYCWFGFMVWNQDYPVLTDTSSWDFSFDWTSGSAISTVQDILTWTAALFGGQVLNRQSLIQMTIPLGLTGSQGPLPFGFGLEVVNPDPWFGERAFLSRGQSFGVLTRWLYYPDSQRTVFLALNRLDQSDPPQVDAVQAVDDLLRAAGSLMAAASE